MTSLPYITKIKYNVEVMVDNEFVELLSLLPGIEEEKYTKGG
jgi:hypothetical protein